MLDEPSAERPPYWFVVTLGALDVLKVAVRMAAFVAMVYLGVTVPVRETAGQETVLALAYRVVLDMRLHDFVPYVAVCVFGWLWWRERRTRITVVERENRRNRELEEKIDSGRTLSGFDETGRRTTSSGGA